MITEQLDSIFAALADPTRPLGSGAPRCAEATVNQLAEPFRMSLPTVSTHLEELVGAGVVGTAAHGRRLLDRRRLAGAEVDGVAHVVRG